MSTTINNRLVTESGLKIHTEALLESEVRFLRLAVGQAGMYKENEGLVLSIFNEGYDLLNIRTQADHRKLIFQTSA